jgi:poly(A) polymerase
MIDAKRTPHPLPHDYFDADALKVVRRLLSSGYAAYLVGGGVRDLLLARRPKDFDVATNARPEEVRALFRNCRLVGRRFRLAHIHFPNNKVIEVSTFRRTPQDVEGDDLMIRDDNSFGNEAEDSLRRDFTINALFYDVESQTVIDYVGGVSDLRAKVIRTIGDPVTRFREDPVRILRGLKFAARLGLSIESECGEAASQVGPDLLRCAKPRILEELLRMLRGGHAERSFVMMLEYGVLEVILPDLHRVLVEETAPDEAGQTDADRLWSALRAVDEENAARAEPLSDAVLWAALYAAPIEKAAARAGRKIDPHVLAAQVAGPTLERLNVSRRLRDRFLRIIVAQTRLRSPKRGPRPAAFARRDFFSEAVALFSLLCKARGEEENEDLRFWSRFLEPGALEEAPPSPPSPPEPRDKPRRRGRRRGRSRGRGASGAGHSRRPAPGK